MNKLYLSVLVLICLNCSIARGDYPDNVVTEKINSLKIVEIIELDSIKEGDAYITEYAEYNVFIYRRTKSDLAYLNSYLSGYNLSFDRKRWQSSTSFWKGSSIDGPIDYVFRSEQGKFDGLKYRSLDKNYFVVIGTDPQYRCNVKVLDENLIGFLNPPKEAVFWHICHGQFFDSAGREINKDGSFSKQGKNLLIPPYTINNKGEVILGDADLSGFDRKIKVDYDGLSIQESLWKACRFNDYSKVLSSLKENADPNLLVERGNALDSAIIWSSKETVELLIKYGAKPTGLTKELMETLSRKDISEILKNLSI